MIAQLKTITPVIDLGFGSTQQEVTAGTPITVWLNTIYNQEVYSFSLMATGAAVTKISDYEYVVAYPLPGMYEVKMIVGTADKKISLESNILNVIVK